MTKLAVTMSWNDELVATDRVKTLTAGDIRSRCAAVHEVLGRPTLKTPVKSLQAYTGYVRECPASAAQSDVNACRSLHPRQFILCTSKMTCHQHPPSKLQCPAGTWLPSSTARVELSKV